MTILRNQICVTEGCLSFSEVREFSDENLSEFAGKSFGIAGREKLSTKSATNIHRHVHTRLAHPKAVPVKKQSVQSGKVSRSNSVAWTFL